ncbi:helicase-related protein [Rhodopirellula europaea]|uniref:helicase-related protein n=1 Tax=Rhodopirellula europaea TaxID=1263866 RepID=UPI00191C1984|nr:helicase-related protein [Rhodopirellula europaea]
MRRFVAPSTNFSANTLARFRGLNHVAQLEEITKDAIVAGIIPSGKVTIIDAKWHGSDVLQITYRAADGTLGDELLYRDNETSIEIVEASRPWSFNGDGELLRLVSEALRIRLAFLFDPVLAVHTSLVEPYPHQISAVYEEMLTRQPLRFLLADDPGAGKTIMAGLLIKELIVRGDLRRCMIVAPGSLVEQWQDEMFEKFQVPFEVMTNDNFEAARTGNWFGENDMVVCRLDKLSRNERVQEKLKAAEDYDLIIVDEAHKMSASVFGGEVKETKRYKLGREISKNTRHFLLMSATPHNGKEEDFQLFMALLDGDRFEGRSRQGVHTVDASDMMRRMVKEQLYKFDETKLFPERIAHTIDYPLSNEEAALYRMVSDYVRNEFNRASALENGGRKGTVGFALTILQRRLASSPEAIYESLRRRRERLQNRVREEELLSRGGTARIDNAWDLPSFSDDDDIEDFEDAPGDEYESQEQRIVDGATAAQTIAELRLEIDSLSQLETFAKQVRDSGHDRKWEELSSLLGDDEHMKDETGARRKIVIFTEHRDTLNYLTRRIRKLLGSEESVVTISGGMLREERRNAQELFTHDEDTKVLIATDAAGEGINLQCAHLMVNYDLPWNPNRLEQRFGRIHRIGQTEVCHLWNLVAGETREGAVFQRLLEKLDVEREALGGAVFDVLGQAIDGKQLREMLRDAMLYNSLPEVKAQLFEKVDGAVAHERLQDLIENQSLAGETMDTSRVRQIRDDMERANARRLQPHYISTFFQSALELLGGAMRERETDRYEITRVPGIVRSRDRVIGTRESVLKKYQRSTFKKELINVQGKPQAAFICPGHPLLDSVIDIILERHRDLLKQGAVLIDENAKDEKVRAVFCLENSIQDGRTIKDSSRRRIVSRQLQFVSIDQDGEVQMAGSAPYLDMRGATKREFDMVEPLLQDSWINADLETKAISFAIGNLVPKHFQDLKRRREALVDKTNDAVKKRLTQEIAYWDHRAQELKAEEEAGKKPKLNSQNAQARADRLSDRLQERLKELAEERKLSPLPPIAHGGALVVPIHLLHRLAGTEPSAEALAARETKRSEMLAMEAVMRAERDLGNTPTDVSHLNCGYDIESACGQTGRLRFIEVKGRLLGGETVTVTRNEIVTGVNAGDSYILAIVQIENDAALLPVYVRSPFMREPDFGVTRSDYKIKDMLKRGTAPA